MKQCLLKFFLNCGKINDRVNSAFDQKCIRNSKYVRCKSCGCNVLPDKGILEVSGCCGRNSAVMGFCAATNLFMNLCTSVFSTFKERDSLFFSVVTLTLLLQISPVISPTPKTIFALCVQFLSPLRSRAPPWIFSLGLHNLSVSPPSSRSAFRALVLARSSP